MSAAQINDATPPETRSILSEAREINLKRIKKLAHRTWGSLTGLNWADPLLAVLTVFDIDPASNAAQRPQFFCRTRSLMIVKTY